MNRKQLNTIIPESWALYVFQAQQHNRIPTNTDGMFERTSVSFLAVKRLALAGVTRRISLDSERDDYSVLVPHHISMWLQGGGALEDIEDKWAVALYKATVE